MNKLRPPTPLTDAAEHEDSPWCANLGDFARTLETAFRKLLRQVDPDAKQARFDWARDVCRSKEVKP